MLQITKLREYPKLFHAFSTKDNGNMANAILGEKVDFNKVFENRKNFLSKINVDINSCICMWVMGEDGIAEVNTKDAGVSMKDYKKAVKIDALVTNIKNLFIFLLTADCAPVILYDPVKEAVGVAHIGWKGADLGIVRKVIKRLSDLYKSKSEDLIIGIGPSARGESYIKKNPSQRNKIEWKGFIKKVTTRKGRHPGFSSGSREMLKKFQHDKEEEFYKVDFVGLCKKQLVESGVKEKNIFDCGVDTAKDSLFFSHYREKDKYINKQGRFACIVGLK
jgi:YfiH family protein